MELKEDLIVIEGNEAKEKLDSLVDQIRKEKDEEVKKSLLTLLNIYLFQTYKPSDREGSTISDEEWEEYKDFYEFQIENKTSELEEAVEIHDELNPKIWTAEKELLPSVKEKILAIVQKFKELLKLDNVDLKVEDIYVLGSNANYNYNEESDLDVHIIADESFDCSNEHLPIIYQAYKALFNNKYDITIKGINVELYVENKDKISNVSSGVYSLTKGWIKSPARYEIPEIDQLAIDKGVQFWEDKYYAITEDPSITKIDDYIDDIYNLRQTSIQNEGEFGEGNLIFKEIRRLGYLDELKQLKIDLTSQELSLESFNESLKKYLAEGCWGMPYTLEQVNKLKELMSKPVDAFEVGDHIENKNADLGIGDDELFDRISKYRAEHKYGTKASEDVRKVIQDFIKDEVLPHFDEYTYAQPKGDSEGHHWEEGVKEVFQEIASMKLTEDVEKEIKIQGNDDIIEDDKKLDPPIDLDYFPNNMGINLCSVKSEKWVEQDDGQLKEIKIEFDPATEEEKAEQEDKIEEEVKEKVKYIYSGPLYVDGRKLIDEWEDITYAVSDAQALNQLRYKARQKLGLDMIDLVPECLVREEKPVKDEPFKEKPKCSKCGRPLTTSGECPLCDLGDESVLDEEQEEFIEGYKIKLPDRTFFKSEIIPDDDILFDTEEEAEDFVSRNYNRIEFMDGFEIVKVK